MSNLKLNKKKVQKKKRKNPPKGNYAKNEKYPALNPKRQVFNRREYVDMDYIDKLNDEEKEFLNSFISETVVTNFNHAGEEIYTDQEDKRKFYSDNNARNRCMLSMAKSKNLMNNIEDIASTYDRNYYRNPDDMENAMITAIELKRSGKLGPELDKPTNPVGNTKNKTKKTK